MNWTVEFDQAPHDVTVTADGQARASEFGRLFEELCLDERFKPGMLILLDLSNVDMDLVPQASVGRSFNGLAALRDRCDGCALAIVCTTPLASSLMRAGDMGESVPWMNVWRALTADEAAAWLRTQAAFRDAGALPAAAL